MNPQHTRNLLLRRHSELARRLLTMEADLQATQTNDTPLETLAAQTFRELVQVRRVLKKIGGEEYSQSECAHTDANTAALDYGTCCHCGRPIGPTRLKALPYTHHCIQCAHERDMAATH